MKGSWAGAGARCLANGNAVTWLGASSGSKVMNHGMLIFNDCSLSLNVAGPSVVCKPGDRIAISTEEQEKDNSHF